MTLYYVNHVIHPIETPDSIYGVGVYHAFLVVWPIWSEILWWKANSSETLSPENPSSWTFWSEVPIPLLPVSRHVVEFSRILWQKRPLTKGKQWQKSLWRRVLWPKSLWRIVLWHKSLRKKPLATTILVPIWNHPWFYIIKSYAKREEIMQIFLVSLFLACWWEIMNPSQHHLFTAKM